jgi:hypothetical protein
MTNQKNPPNFHEQHKRDVIWQIWLPVGFGAIAMLTLGMLSIFSLQTGADASARWGHVATIWLILPFFIYGLIVFGFLAGGIFMVVKATSVLPGFTAIVQMYARLMAQKIQSLANKSVQPVLTTKSTQAAWRRFWLAFRYMILGGYHN